MPQRVVYNPATGQLEDEKTPQGPPVNLSTLQNAVAPPDRMTPESSHADAVPQLWQARGGPPSLLPNKQTKPMSMTDKDFGNMLSMLLKGTAIAAAFTPVGEGLAPLLAQGLVSGGLEYAGDKAAQDPEANLVGSLSMGAGLGGVAKASTLAPRYFTRGALKLGGFQDNPVTRDAEEAFLRESARMRATPDRSVEVGGTKIKIGSSLPVADVKKATTLRNATTEALQHAESESAATGNSVPLSNVMGGEKPGIDMANNSMTVFPGDDVSNLKGIAAKYRDMQSEAHLARSHGVDIPTAEEKAAMAGTSVQKKWDRAVQRNVPKVRLNAEQLGSQSRQLAENARAELANSLAASHTIQPDAKEALDWEANLVKKLTQNRNDIVQGGAALDQRQRDLALIADVNHMIGRKGGMLTDISQQGVRAGFGHGVGQNMVAIGAPKETGWLMTMLSPALNPTTVSKAGYGTRNVGLNAQKVLRALELADQASKTMKRE